MAIELSKKALVSAEPEMGAKTSVPELMRQLEEERKLRIKARKKAQSLNAEIE